MQLLVLLHSQIFLILGFLFFIICAAFFTASEVALISSDKLFLKRKQNEKVKGASYAVTLLNNIDDLLIATQFGTNFSLAAATTLLTLLSISQFGHNNWRFIIIITPILLLFSDILPKVLARANANQFSLFCAIPLSILNKIFYFFIMFLKLYTKKISKITGTDYHDSWTRRKKTREELESLLSDESKENEIKLNQRRMIRRILDFSYQIVKRIMVPLVNIDAIENNKTVREAVDLFQDLRHSRIPIYQERIDNIIGILHIDDLFKCQNPDDPIMKYLRPALFVPEHQQVDSLINEMKLQNMTMAVVVDEYGGAVGLVTKEDVLQEVVGDYSDEFDTASLTFREISENTFLANVNIAIDDLNERLHTKLPQGDYETLSGFLLQQFNRIPGVGDELFYGKLKFKIHRGTEKSIKTVIITQEPETVDETLEKI